MESILLATVLFVANSRAKIRGRTNMKLYQIKYAKPDQKLALSCNKPRTKMYGPPVHGNSNIPTSTPIRRAAKTEALFIYLAII
jgi:hypothetical protein